MKKKYFTELDWYAKLEDEVQMCHLIVTYHNQLVVDKDNILLLNNVAGTFFATVVDSYRLNLMHILSRLFDPAFSHKFENISIKKLIDQLDGLEGGYLEGKKDLIKAVDIYTDNDLVQDRNKEFMHNDLDFLLSGKERIYKLDKYMMCLNLIITALENIDLFEGVDSGISRFLDSGSAQDLINRLKES